MGHLTHRSVNNRDTAATVVGIVIAVDSGHAFRDPHLAVDVTVGLARLLHRSGHSRTGGGLSQWEHWLANLDGHREIRVAQVKTAAWKVDHAPRRMLKEIRERSLLRRRRS